MFCSQRDIPTIEFYIHSEMVELGAYNNLLGSNSYLVLRGTYIYTITWLLCAFSLVVDRDLLKDTHTQMASNPRQITSADLFFFFHASKILQ